MQAHLAPESSALQADTAPGNGQAVLDAAVGVSTHSNQETGSVTGANAATDAGAGAAHGGTAQPNWDVDQNLDPARAVGPQFPIKPNGPERRCVATGLILPKAQLLRFVLAPDDTVTFDSAQKLPGRGMWMVSDPAAFALAQKKGVFSRAAKKKVSMPADLMARVTRVLDKQLLNHLGLARRSGALVLGTAKVQSALDAGELSAVWIAKDASPNTVDQWVWAVEDRRGRGNTAIIQALSHQDMAMALGRATVVVMGFVRQGSAKLAREQRTVFVPDGVERTPPMGAGWQNIHQTLQHLVNLAGPEGRPSG